MKNKNDNKAPREHLGSRLGFILLSAGCAIGLGNVWKFPYMVGQYGGGVFVLLYLVFLAVLGIPVMTMEFALGRAAQKSPAKMYQQLEPKGSKWHWHGYVAVGGNYLLMMFYTSVSAWLIQYCIKMAKGDFVGLSQQAVDAQYDAMLADPLKMCIFVAIVVVVGFLVCSFSLQKGLEKVTKIMMLALLAIMVVLAVYSCFFMEGAKEGLSFYLIPDFQKIKNDPNISLFEIIVGAMNQSFFTLSLGLGSMAIFGSYLKKDRSLMGEAVNVAVLDTFVAITSGLIIFPACFTFGIQPGAGPSLIFKTLPAVFNRLPLGRLWGTLFFIFLAFAAMSTIFAVFENIISCTRDIFGWSRRKACLINCGIMFVLSLPCVFGFNLLSFIKPFGTVGGSASTIMDLEDFIVSNLLLPLGSLIFVIFCTSRYGWGWKKFSKEANEGQGLKMPKWIRPYATYVLPIIIVFIFAVGIISFLNPILEPILKPYLVG